MASVRRLDEQAINERLQKWSDQVRTSGAGVGHILVIAQLMLLVNLDDNLQDVGTSSRPVGIFRC